MKQRPDHLCGQQVCDKHVAWLAGKYGVKGRLACTEAIPEMQHHVQGAHPGQAAPQG